MNHRYTFIAYAHIAYAQIAYAQLVYAQIVYAQLVYAQIGDDIEFIYHSYLKDNLATEYFVALESLHLFLQERRIRKQQFVK